MTLFSPKEKAFYTHCGFGIGVTPCSFEMWNLLSLSNRAMFAFENELLSDRLPASFDETLIKAAEKTLSQTLGDKRILYYMRLDSPWHLYESLKSNKHANLKLDAWHKGRWQGLVKARCYAWESRKLTKDEKGFVLMHSRRYQS